MNQMQDVVGDGAGRGGEGRGDGGAEGECAASVSDFYGNILPDAAAAPFLISGRLFAETT